MTTTIWECKIGEVHSAAGGADYLMRQAVADAYKATTGVEPVFIFSGWGASLTEAERAVVENRLPAPATTPAQPEIVDLLAEMYELILANKVVLAEKSGGVWTWPDRAIEAVRKHRSGPAQPERTPMTKEQREQVARRAEAAMNGNVNLSWRDALISETEAFHDIKETP